METKRRASFNSKLFFLQASAMGGASAITAKVKSFFHKEIPAMWFSTSRKAR